MTTPRYNPESMRLWADWYDDITDVAPPYQWGDDPGHAELLRDHATAIEALNALALEDISALKAERDSLKQHAEAMADAIQFGDLAILTVAKAAADSYRAAHPLRKP